MSASHPYKVKVLSKREMHPLSAAAAISGEVMMDISSAASGLAHKSSYAPPVRNSEVVYSNLITVDRDHPAWEDLLEDVQFKKKVTPGEIRNARNVLWLKVGWSEKRVDSQFGRLFSMTLPPALSLERGRNALVAFAKDILANEGMIVDVAIHESAHSDESAKRQAFALATMRPCRRGEFTNKDRDWNQKAKLVEWRAKWFSILRAEVLAQIKEEPENEPKFQECLAWANRYAPALSASAKAAAGEKVKDDPFGFGSFDGEALDDKKEAGRPRL